VEGVPQEFGRARSVGRSECGSQRIVRAHEQGRGADHVVFRGVVGVTDGRRGERGWIVAPRARTRSDNRRSAAVALAGVAVLGVREFEA
jgi:hypothetical protein